MLFVTTIRVMPEAAIQQASHPASQPANTTSAAKPHAPFKRLVHSCCAFGPANMDNSLHWAVPRILPPLASHHDGICQLISPAAHQPISPSANQQINQSVNQPTSQSSSESANKQFHTQPHLNKKPVWGSRARVIVFLFSFSRFQNLNST